MSSKAVASGMIGGAVVAVMAFALSMFAAGAGHGTYAPAKVLFPYSMLLTSLTGTITPGLLVLAAVQWPIYGYVVSGRPRSRWAVVGAIHVIAVTASFLFSNPSFSP